MAEELAGLPGGGDELAAILRKVNGTPETIRGIATRWEGTATKVSTNTGKLRTAVKNIDSAWHGSSADAFVTHMRDYGTAGDGLHDVLKTAATTLRTTAQTLETAEAKVRGFCDTLLGQVRTFRTNNPKATQAEFDEAIAPLVREILPDARKHLADADEAVNDAEKKIRLKLDGREMTFEGITPPGDETHDWRPTTVPDWSKTTLASTDGGGAQNPAASSYASTGGPAGGDAPAIPYVRGNGTGADIVAAARQHLGKPYIWGANGPSAFDCSGLVYYSLNQAGIKIGDTTAAGYQRSGRPVTDPQPGDIVFFGEPAGHVGIYVGDGKMIHAPRPGSEVTVASVAGRQPITFRRFT
ncbi:WXG100 family type VII secretion target [Nonomuraea lactucae]|uniref:bifunctional WXG100 family type VII secretion target/C40 family peptidase n=1 Tax=Nonomuraea lactucae TaxID=2249762 RepID=UPI0013B44085|nr:WXG100 family type VII secretion target [Nonomuraea lactucae]